MGSGNRGGSLGYRETLNLKKKEYKMRDNKLIDEVITAFDSNRDDWVLKEPTTIGDKTYEEGVDISVVLKDYGYVDRDLNCLVGVRNNKIDVTDIHVTGDGEFVRIYGEDTIFHLGPVYWDVTYGKESLTEWGDYMPIAYRELYLGCKSLEDLMFVMVNDPEEWSSIMPSFGGEAPEDTYEIWSWDDNRILVGSCGDDLSIVDRAVQLGGE